MQQPHRVVAGSRTIDLVIGSSSGFRSMTVNPLKANKKSGFTEEMG